LMSQYYPLFKASNFPEINQVLKADDFNKIIDYQLSLGMENGWFQEPGSETVLVPDFKKINPFK
jgi:putative pyruvate formate lyase activating enzyme